MKKILLLFLLILVSQVSLSQTNKLVDERRLQTAEDTLNRRSDSLKTAIGSITGTSNTRIDSLIIPVSAHDDSISALRTYAQANRDSIQNKYTKSDARTVIADSLAEVRDSIDVRYTKTDTRSVIADSLSEMRDSIGVRYTKTDTRSVIADSLSEIRDSIGVRYTKTDTRSTIHDTVAVIRDTLGIHRVELNAHIDSLRNKYTMSDARNVLADSLSEIRDSLGVRYTKTDTRSVIHDSVAVQRDSIGTHRTELNAQMDSLKNKYTESDTRIVIADSLAEMRDSVGNRYTKSDMRTVLADSLAEVRDSLGTRYSKLDANILFVAKATMPTVIGIACSDETTALTASTSVAKVTFRVPYAMTVTAVRASVTTAPTDATILVDIHESGTTILSTKIMIDASEFTSTTAATGYVISDASLADDAEITVFADQVGSSVAGAGLKIWIIGTRVTP